MDVSVLLEPTINLARLTEVLDGLGHEGRVHTIRTWGHRQAELFEAAKGYMPLDLEYFVPSSRDSGKPILHIGKNTLPAFSLVQKRCIRTPEGEESKIVGYNDQPFAWFSGPGYFAARQGEGEHENEVIFDYTKPVLSKAEQWPPIRPNSGRLGRVIVYGGLVDYMRGLSKHVSIGRAYKNGKPMDQYFAMTREDPG